MNENLGAAAAVMDRWMTAIEKLCGSSGWVQVVDAVLVSWEGEPRDSAVGVRQSCGEAPSPLLQPPAWSTVLRKGVWKHHKPSSATGQPNNAAVTARLKRDQRRKIRIISTDGNIPVVKTKLVCVFATRFSPSLDSDTLCFYLTERMGKPVACRKTDSTRNRFSSLHVIAECNEIADMYEPQLWPAVILRLVILE